MNTSERARLAALRNAVAGMSDDQTPSTSSALWRIGEAKDVCDGQPKPVPTHINMGTLLAKLHNANVKNDCATVGCVAGITITLYPAETHAEWTKEQENAERTNSAPDRFASIGRVLGLPPETAASLFFAHGSNHEHSLERISKEDVLNALDGAIAGRSPSTLWANKLSTEKSL